jgi:ABC-type transport system involved in cytochrome bd biosynthesis fused ATPase/permease subunit
MYRYVAGGMKIMKLKEKRKNYLPLIMVGGAIPTLIILANIFNMPKAAVIILVIILALVFGSMALWNYANRNADGSEWWQDDNASGWRGY